MKKKILQYIFYSFCLLFIFHFETLNIGPFKISHLWKGIFMIMILSNFMKNKFPGFHIYKPLIFLSFLMLLNYEIFYNPTNAIISFLILLFYPLIGAFLLRFSSERINFLLLYFSSFFILSFVPYQLGLLSSLTGGYDLISYGIESSGLIGPFQKVHAASTTLAGSLIIVTYFWLNKSYNKYLLGVLFVLGFYFLFYTYVRTGLVMYFIGILPILWHFAFKNKQSFIKILIIILISGILAFSFVLSNETLIRRIKGERDFYQEDSVETLGSGRVLFFLASFEIFSESTVIEKIIGIGETELLNRMLLKVGIRVFPHNGFSFLLIANGILGISLFFWFIFKIFIIISHLPKTLRILPISLFLGYLIMTTFQSYDILNMYFLLTLSIAQSLNNQKNIIKVSEI